MLHLSGGRRQVLSCPRRLCAGPPHWPRPISPRSFHQKRPPFWRQTPPEYQARGAAVPGSPACHIHPPPAYWRSSLSNSPLICATAWAGEMAPVVSSGPAKKMPSGEARMMPHRQMTTTTAITTPPPAVAAAASALAAAITARSARFAACAACLAVTRAALAALLGSCQPGSRLRRTAGLSGRKRSYRRFPTRLSNPSRLANGMASRFDRHASLFYCRLCGAAHSLPGGLRVRPRAAHENHSVCPDT